jgi:hypothetical protein
VHSLAGTILIDTANKRLAKVLSHLVTRVDFGYGLLGRIDSGTLELERVEVGPQLWKTAFINVTSRGGWWCSRHLIKTSLSDDPIFKWCPAILASLKPRICWFLGFQRLLKLSQPVSKAMRQAQSPRLS